MFKMLYIKIKSANGTSLWVPALNDEKVPIPSYIVIHTDFLSDMTEEQWIEEYKKLNGNCNNEFAFRAIFKNTL